MVLPDHVIDGTELASVTDQQRGQTCEAIAHQWTSGSGIDSAKPARKTGCANPSGATLGAEPSGALSATRTLPSAIIWICFFSSPLPAGLSTRPPRDISV